MEAAAMEKSEREKIYRRARAAIGAGAGIILVLSLVSCVLVYMAYGKSTRAAPSGGDLDRFAALFGLGISALGLAIIVYGLVQLARAGRQEPQS
jgi:formate hydrogenlyase subunit 3/multisubunit Na+/H+ antiporter MnhD subunit